MHHKTRKLQRFIPLLFVVLAFSCSATVALAQSVGASASTTSATSTKSVSYIPLIGVTSVPEPSALPKGPGNVTFHYAVKNFLREMPLTDIYVVDDQCETVQFVEGDDNADGKLDYSETWRYSCTTRVSTTTQSTATVVGTANNQVATHDAYATVVVGSDLPPPLVSIINITKVAYPLSLPAEGGTITFTYKVNNPGVVPLSSVVVNDEKCNAMSNKLGDRNNNNLLDVTEVWIYTCKATLTKTTTNTVHVSASANGLNATSHATITVHVAVPGDEKDFPDSPPCLPDTGKNSNIKIMIWAICSTILAVLSALYIFIRSLQHKRLIKQHE